MVDLYGLQQLDLLHSLSSDLWFILANGKISRDLEVWRSEVRVISSPLFPPCRIVGWKYQVPTPKAFKATALPLASPELQLSLGFGNCVPFPLPGLEVVMPPSCC